jgi:phosphatidylserine/phosphatidylglycerophosphate/cardiolipin synthase-like enzyme
VTLPAVTENYLKALVPWADIAPPVLNCLSTESLAAEFDERHLCNSSGLPATQTIAVLALLRRLAELGLIRERSEMQWSVISGSHDTLVALSPLLAAIAFYRNSVHRDETTAKVVLTRPGQPSKLEEALRGMGFAGGRLEMTSEAFGDIAAAARNRLTVMTPFLDTHGARWLGGLLRKVRPGIRTCVILRHLSSPSHSNYPEGLTALRDVLGSTGTEVLDYAISRGTGQRVETFHAKVVLADDDYAYVGSANMSKASLESSMELGILVRGKAARAVASVVEAIRTISLGRNS